MLLFFCGVASCWIVCPQLTSSIPFFRTFPNKVTAYLKVTATLMEGKGTSGKGGGGGDPLGPVAAEYGPAVVAGGAEALAGALAEHRAWCVR